MCGIVGFNWDDKNLVQSMNNSQIHRGPDSGGLYIDKSVSLGSRRLSIIDISSKGNQPMKTDCGEFIIVYNGEIYNYKEIRKDLELRGHIFRSGTDTEVLLLSYKEWGDKCLSRLIGMFSFCIYDKSSQVLFLARDRFGIKPLYYYILGNKFIFSSEIKSILCYVKNYTANDKLIYDYLIYNVTDHTDETLFSEIKKLPGGHYGIYNLNENTFNIREYWSPRNISINNLNYKASLRIFRALLIDSIRLRFRSDVPVGSCFSGGLDSSSIVSIANDILPINKIVTFSAVYPGFEKDESKFIDHMVDEKNIKNYKVSPTAETFFKDIEEFLYYQEEPPRSPSQYSQYSVMKLAHEKNYKVLLDGQGSDEFLCGYNYFIGYYCYDLFWKFEFKKVYTELKSIVNLSNYKIIMGSFLSCFLPKIILKKLQTIRSEFIDQKFIKSNYNKSIYASLIKSNNSLKDYIDLHLNYKLEQLLKWEDKNSMAFSIETRVPFLDHRLVEFALSLPSEHIIKFGRSKSILRDSVRDLVPDLIIDRKDKVGFETPDSKWLESDIGRRKVKELIIRHSQREKKYFDLNKISKLLNLNTFDDSQVVLKIWQFVFVETWLNIFFDKNANIQKP